jgi:hypothetical protein
VIYASSAKDFSEIKEKVIKELTIKNNVPLKKLKFFQVKENDSDIEFWLANR